MSKEIKICFPESKSEELDLLSLPFKSTYRVLSWKGSSSNFDLVPNFNIIDLQGKFLIIKSFRTFLYTRSPGQIDIFLTDGIVSRIENLPANCRINRLFDRSSIATQINMIINGGNANFFNANFPLDVNFQNIYYKFPEKIQSLSLRVISQYYRDILNQITSIMNVLVNMEVYLN